MILINDEPVTVDVVDHDFTLSGGIALSFTLWPDDTIGFTPDMITITLAKSREVHQINSAHVLHAVTRRRTMTVPSASPTTAQ